MIDVLVPASPNGVGVSGTPEHALNLNVAIAADYACVTYSAAGLRVAEVDTSAIPTKVGYYQTQFFAEGIDVTGNDAFVGTKNGELIIFRFTGSDSNLALAEQYKPVLKRADGEVYYPVMVDYALRVSNLRNEYGQLLESSPTVPDLVSHADDGSCLDNVGGSPSESQPWNQRLITVR